jgi:hypothetical protein
MIVLASFALKTCATFSPLQGGSQAIALEFTNRQWDIPSP